MLLICESRYWNWEERIMHAVRLEEKWFWLAGEANLASFTYFWKWVGFIWNNTSSVSRYWYCIMILDIALGLCCVFCISVFLAWHGAFFTILQSWWAWVRYVRRAFASTSAHYAAGWWGNIMEMYRTSNDKTKVGPEVVLHGGGFEKNLL